MEESCLITLLSQKSGNACHLIHRGWRQDEGFYKHRNGREDRRHSVNTLPTIAETVFEGDALGYQRVDERCIAFVPSVLQVFVEGSDVLPAETLDDKHHNILLGYTLLEDGLWLVNGRIDGLQLCRVLEVIGNFKDCFANGAIERERRVEHKGRIAGTLHVLIGIGYGNGAYRCGETSTDASNHKGCPE